MNKRISTAVQSHRERLPVFVLLGILLLVVSACTLGSSTTPATGGQATSIPPAGVQATSIPTAGVPATSIPAAGVPASSRDVQSMDACALFPGAAVATALNATLADPNNPGTSFGGPDCTYYFSPNGGGASQLYILNLIPVNLFQPSLTGGLANPQPVAGLGDQAFIGTRVGTTTTDLLVLKSGDLAIEVVGGDAVTAQKLVEYVLANLP